jgi:hypothetical protein
MLNNSLDGFDLALGTSCLRWLINDSPMIAHAGDAAVVMLIGQIMLVYNNLIPCSYARDITRGALLSARDWYPSLMSRPELDSITVPLLLVDTIECLVAREVPVLRLPVTNRYVVDRFMGISSSLLPLLYDLCECSYRVKTGGYSTDDGLWTSDEPDPYFHIEQSLKNWKPPGTIQLLERFSASEIDAMIIQARLYRLAALLIIHRLRFPLGINDDLAHGYAKDILDDLSHMKTWPYNGATGLGLDFPLLIAAVEFPVIGEEIFRSLNQLRFRQTSDDYIEFVRCIRQAHTSGYRGLWPDLVGKELPLPVLP